jgi:hypothetical protein
MDKENKNERGIILPHPQEIFSEERFFHEINILRIEGFYFCHDPKAAAKQSGKLNFLDRLKIRKRLSNDLLPLRLTRSIAGRRC